MFYEDDENVLVVQFGLGDVLVMPGQATGGTDVWGVALIDNCGKCSPIGKPCMSDEEWEKFKKEKDIETDRDLNTMVRFVFDKPESIDTLIWGLEEAKKGLLSAHK